MLRLFHSLRRRRPSRRRTARRRIQFESLERRYCLSAPAISSFEIDSIDHDTVSVSGYVSDDGPETVEVHFFGALAGSTSPNASGYFAFAADADWLGEIGAVAYDDESLSSDSSLVSITSDVPTIDSLSVGYGEGTDFTITGQVIDDSPDGLTVQMIGAVQGAAITDSSGYFTFATPEGSGYVEVVVADAWAQEATDSVEILGRTSSESLSGPLHESLAEGESYLEINDFSTYVDAFGYLTAEGTVTGADPADVTVTITFLETT